MVVVFRTSLTFLHHYKEVSSYHSLFLNPAITMYQSFQDTWEKKIAKPSECWVVGRGWILLIFMHTKTLTERLSFFQSSKIPPGDIWWCCCCRTLFPCYYSKVGSYEVANITFLIVCPSEDKEAHHNLFSRCVKEAGKSSSTRWEHIFYEVPALFIICNTSIVSYYSILILEKQIINFHIFLT